MLPALLAGRLGIEQLVEERVDLGDRPGAANPGRKVMSLVSAMALGADCIEDCGLLRAGQPIPTRPKPRTRQAPPDTTPSGPKRPSRPAQTHHRTQTVDSG